MIRAPRSVLPSRTTRGKPVAALFAVWALVTAAYIAAPLTQGLRGEYFEGLESSGPAAHTARDADISSAAVAMRWWFAAPQAFHVRWTGYLIVERAGLYTFQITSDDGTQLRIGDSLVIDNLQAPASAPPSPGFNSRAARIASCCSRCRPAVRMCSNGPGRVMVRRLPRCPAGHSRGTGATRGWLISSGACRGCGLH